jgi:ubiquinone biosynthesis accessory factor UbiJ
MLKPIVTRFLQHICSQNNWSREYLQPFAGKTIAFDFVLIKANIIILEDGSLALGGETHAPEASVYAPPSLLLRMMANNESAKMQIKVEGDTHLATEFSKVLQNMRWDIEEDLSHFTGDIVANKIGSATKKILQTAKQQSIDAAEMLSEYWQEEKTILAKKRHVEQFNADVDALKSDVARFEKRLQKLTKKQEQESAN